MILQTIAVDFDGTIVKHAFPLIGELIPGAKETLEFASSVGIEIILWTCREGEHLEEAYKFCGQNGIPIDSANRNVDLILGYAARKLVASMYIDDRGFWPGRQAGTDFTEADWGQVRRAIEFSDKPQPVA